MQTVTVLTPTYNRAKQIADLYKSLMKQSSFDFIWLIVDDGSTDNTQEIIRKFANQSKFDVQYCYKQNGGKHTALNTGISKINTPLTIIVDSDDTLLPKGIETILLYYQKYRNEQDICGFSFLKAIKNGDTFVKLPKDEFIESHIECRIKNKLPGDMAEVFYSQILRKYPFPEFCGEKFLSEDIVWIAMGETYKLVFIKQPIYQYEYLDDGLTNNDKKLKFNSPYGSMLRGKKLMINRCGFVSWIRGAIIYNCYKKEIHNKKNLPEIVLLKGFRCKLIAICTKPLGLFFNWYWKKSFESGR